MDQSNDMIIKVIGQVVGAAAMLWIMFYLAQGAKKTNARSKDHKGELRMSKIYLYLGGFFVVLIPLYLIILITDYSHEFFVIFIFSTVLFAGLGLPTLLAYLRHRLYFNESYLRVNNWRKQSTEIEWKNIKNVKYQKYSGNIVIESDTSKVKISRYFVGLAEFLNELNRHTGYNAHNLNIPNF